MVTWTGLSFNAWSPAKMLHRVCDVKIKFIENRKTDNTVIPRTVPLSAVAESAKSYSRIVNLYLCMIKNV
jgi:hypothetical protein